MRLAREAQPLYATLITNFIKKAPLNCLNIKVYEKSVKIQLALTGMNERKSVFTGRISENFVLD